MDVAEATSRSSEEEARVVLLVRIASEQEDTRSPLQPARFVNIVEAIWSKGGNRELFETLWSHLSRKLLDNFQR
jgi:hypothetical protein